jgi:hypothetical protein
MQMTEKGGVRFNNDLVKDLLQGREKIYCGIKCKCTDLFASSLS